MEFVRFGHTLNTAAMGTRHDFVFAAQHPNHDEFTQQYFRLSCARNRPSDDDYATF
jgi:hypothetical protein